MSSATITPTMAEGIATPPIGRAPTGAGHVPPAQLARKGIASMAGRAGPWGLAIY